MADGWSPRAAASWSLNWSSTCLANCELEHVGLEPVCMIDARGVEHEFQFRTRLFGPGVAIDALELRGGSPAGYVFQVIGEPDDDPLELTLPLSDVVHSYSVMRLS